jgi:hypothetical protein
MGPCETQHLRWCASTRFANTSRLPGNPGAPKICDTSPFQIKALQLRNQCLRFPNNKHGFGVEGTRCRYSCMLQGAPGSPRNREIAIGLVRRWVLVEDR